MPQRSGRVSVERSTPVTRGRRIVILNQYALPAGSAGITRHGDIGAELVRRGYSVTVIASHFNYLTRQPFVGRTMPTRHAGVQFIWLRTGAYSGNDSRRVRSMAWFSAAATWTAIRLRPRPDVIIGSSPHLLAGGSAFLAARLLGRPWVLEVRDFWPSALVDLGAIARGGRLHTGLERIERYLYAHANAVVTVPPAGHLRLDEVGIDPAKCIHIPNSVAWDDDSGDAPQPPLTLQQIVASRRGRFILVYVGSLGVTHDFDTFLKGVATIKSKADDVYQRLAIVLVGDGVERERIERMTHEMGLTSISFHSSVEKRVVPWVLSRADAGLMQAGPAEYFKYGLSPNKLFDYFAAGKPVLISSKMPTIVDEAKAGIRYRPGDPDAVADAVIRMVRTPPDELADMGARGRELTRTRYSVAAVTDQYEDLIQALVAESAR